MSTLRENIVTFKGIDELSGVANRAASNVERSLSRMERSVGGAAGKQQEANKIFGRSVHQWERSGRAMDMAGRGFMMTGTLMSATLIGATTLATKTAASMEDAMTGVRKVTDLTADQYAELDTTIKKMSTEIPYAYEEIAGTMEMVGRLGFGDTIGELEEMSKVFMDMGVATVMSSEEAAEGMARFMNIMGTAPEQARNLGSSMVELGNNMAANEQEILNLGLRLAGTGNQVGMAESEIIGLAATMASLGIRAEMGGGAMSKFMNQLNTDVRAGGEKAFAWADLAGMSVDELTSKLDTDFAGAMVDVLKGFDDAAERGENLDQVMRDLGIGDIRMLDTLKRLTSGHEMLAEAIEMSGRAWDDNTALSEEASLRYATFFSQLIMFQNRLRNIQSLFGEVFMDIFGEFFKIINPVIERVYDFLEGIMKVGDEITPLGYLIGSLTIAFIALFAAMIPIGFIVMVAGQLIFMAVATGASAVVLIQFVAVLGTLFVALVTVGVMALFYKDSIAGFVSSIGKYAESVKKFTRDLVNFVKRAYAIMQLDSSLEAKWASIGKLFSASFPEIAKFGNDVRNVIQGMVDFVKKSFGIMRSDMDFGDKVVSIGDLFSESFPQVGRFIDQLGHARGVFGDFTRLLQRSAHIFGMDIPLIDKLRYFADDLIFTIGGTNRFTEALNNGVQSLIIFGGRVAEFTSLPLREQFDIAKESIQNFLPSVDSIEDSFDSLKESISDLLEDLPSLGGAFDAVKGKVQEIAEGFSLGGSSASFLSSSMGLLWGIIRRSPLGMLISGLVMIATGLYNAWQESETFRQYFTDLGDYLDETFSPIIEAIVDYVKEDLPEAWEKANKRIGSIVDEVVSMATELKESWDSFSESFMEAYDKYLSPVVDWLIEKFIDLKEQFIEAIGSIKDYWDENGEAIKNGFVALGEVILAAIIIVAAIVVPIILGLLTVVIFTLSWIITAWNGFVILMLGLVATFGHLMDGDWEAAWEQLKETAIEIFDLLFDWMDGWFGDLVGMAKEKWDELKSVFTGEPLADNILSNKDLINATMRIQQFADGSKESLGQVAEEFLRTAFAVDTSTGEIIGLTDQAEKALVENYDIISEAIEKAEIPIRSYSEEFGTSMGEVEGSSTSARDKVLEDYAAQKEASEEAGESVASTAAKYLSSFEEMMEGSDNLSFSIGDMAGSVGEDFSLIDDEVFEIVESFGLLGEDGAANVELLSAAVGIATGEIAADGSLLEQFGTDAINALQRANLEGSAHISSLEQNVGGKVGELNTHTAEFAPAEANLSDPLEKADSRGSGAMSEMDASVGKSIKSMLAIVGAVGATTAIAITAFNIMKTSITSAMSSATSSVTQDFNDMSTKITRQSSTMSRNIVRNFEQMESGVSGVMRRTQSNVSSSISSMNSIIRSYYGAFYSSGSYLMSGFNSGMWSMSGRVQATARSIANSAASTIRNSLRIMSPSRVAMEIGGFFTEGIAIGMDNEADMVSKSATSIANTMQALTTPNHSLRNGVSSIASKLNDSMNASVSQSVEIGRQPAYISVDIGGQEFRAFSDNIYQENTKRANLRDSFSIR